MELSYILLARSVELNTDGSLSVLGLDFETLTVSESSPVAPLAVIARLDGDESDEDIHETATTELDVIGPRNISVLDAPFITTATPGR